MNRHVLFKVLKFFCIIFSLFIFIDICDAAAKEVHPTKIPEKPRIDNRYEDKKAEKSVADKKSENKKSDGTDIKQGRVAKEEPVIRVGLSDGQTSAVITADDSYVIRDAATGQGLEKLAGKSVTTVTVKNQKFIVNGNAVSAQKIRFSMADDRTSRYLSIAGIKYRGNIVLALSDDKTITVINEVKLDDYIGGVISEEMSPDWPMEALKAQAVAARTFAVYSLGNHDEEGYDVCASTHCQVYGGIDSESPSGLRAVSATRGEIMVYQGKPIYAAFHASSGGMTAGSDETGGTALPYLLPVRDPLDTKTPNRHWQVSMSAKELSAELSAAGFPIGTLKTIELTPMKVGQGAKDRYTSGRIKQICFIGTKQTVIVPGPKLRWIVGLPSTLADVRRGDGKSSSMNSNGKLVFSGPNDEVIFDGYGRGHGIGLSQWGAYSMAEKKSYRDILNHYYKDVDISWLF